MITMSDILSTEILNVEFQLISHLWYNEMDDRRSFLRTLLRVAGTYDISHKHLVQLIITHGILQASLFCNKFLQYIQLYDSKEKLGKCVIHTDDAEKEIIIQKLIEVINDALAPISLRLVQVDDEFDDGNSYVVLVNDRRQSNILIEASGFTSTDLSLFLLWVGRICVSRNGEISKQDAFSVASTLLTKGKKVDEERVLQQFVSNKWLAMDDERAAIRLGTRGIAELQSYFGSHADEFGLQKCVLCDKYIIIKKRAVFCKTCGSRLHRQCALRFKKSMQTEKAVCPGKMISGQACPAEIHVSTRKENTE